MDRKWRRRLVVAGSAALGFVAPGAAGAQTATDYVGSRPPQVAGVEITRSAPDPIRPEVKGMTTGRSVGAGGDGSDQGLPVTGGDVTGLLVLGLSAIGTGTFVVRRSRARTV